MRLKVKAVDEVKVEKNKMRTRNEQKTFCLFSRLHGLNPSQLISSPLISSHLLSSHLLSSPLISSHLLSSPLLSSPLISSPLISSHLLSSHLLSSPLLSSPLISSHPLISFFTSTHGHISSSPHLNPTQTQTQLLTHTSGSPPLPLSSLLRKRHEREWWTFWTGPKRRPRFIERPSRWR